MLKLALVACAVVAALQASGVPADELRLFGEGSKVVRHSSVALSPSQEANLRDMSQSGYFSAMAVVPDSPVSAWVYYLHDLNVAWQFVLASCRIAAQDFGLDPSKCTLYASVIPRSVTFESGIRSGLSAQGALVLSRYRSDHRSGGYGALAIDRLSDVGAVQNYSSREEARTGASQECNKAFREGSAGWEPQLLRWVQSEGLNRCHVVHEMGP